MHRTMRVVGRPMVVASFAVLAAVPACAAQPPASVRPAGSATETIPQRIEEAAIGYVTANYSVPGTSVEIQGAASASASEWYAREAEAGTYLTGGGDVDESGLVYLVTFTGEFRVVGPLGPDRAARPESSFDAGRIVVDDEGRMLSISLGGLEVLDRPLFGDPHAE
jgi:hypothetical protein